MNITFRYDWLEVHDGGSENAPIIGNKLCGNSIPDSIIASGSELFVAFHSSRASWSDFDQPMDWLETAGDWLTNNDHELTQTGFRILVHNETKQSKRSVIKIYINLVSNNTKLI